MTRLNLNSVATLKRLERIDLLLNPLKCDCDLYETWIWMRQHRVQYDIFDFERDVDQVFAKMYTGQKKIANISSFEFFKRYIEPVMLIIILIFGLGFNGFLLFVSFRHADMRTKQNACVIQLATVDVFSLLLNLPLSYWDVVNVRWEFDEILCKLFIVSKDIMVGVTVFSVVALSIERFLVARNFRNLKKICKSKTQPTSWLLLMTWLSAIVTSIPAYFSAVVNVRCLYCPPGNQDYIRNVWTFQLIVYCLLPAATIIFLNVKTSVFLRESIKNIPGEIKDNVRARNRKTVADVVLILAVVFLIIYLPSYVLRVLVAWYVVDINEIFFVSFLTFCLFFCNTLINPVSLFIMSTKFKSYAFHYLPFLGGDQVTRSPVFARNIRR